MVVRVLGAGSALMDLNFSAPQSILDDLGMRFEDTGLASAQVQAQRLQQLAWLGYSATSHTPGGSTFNALYVLACRGHETTFASYTGDDAYGSQFASALHRFGIASALQTLPELATGYCIVLSHPNAARSMSSFLGTAELLDSRLLPGAVLHRADWLVFEGYSFAAATGAEMICESFQSASKRGLKTALSLATPDFVVMFRERYEAALRQGVSLLTGNIGEWCSLVELSPDSADLHSVIKQRFPQTMLTVTKGAQGVDFCEPGGDWRHIEAHRVQEVDGTGSGDAFLGGLIAGLIEQQDFGRAVRLANSIAALAVQHTGARPPARDIAAVL